MSAPTNRSKHLALATTLSLGLLSCGENAYVERRLPLRTFKIEVADGTDTGTVEKPLPFPSAVPAKFPLTVTAIGPDGKIQKGYNHIARLSVVPGRVDATLARVPFVNGVAQVTAEVRFSFGETHIWIEDVGEDPTSDCDNGLDDDGDKLTDAADPDCQKASLPIVAKATDATGISAPLRFAETRIHDVQYAPRCTTNTPLSGEYVAITSGKLIVTGTTQSGMYVTDLEGPEGGFNSLFLYTYSNPGGVKAGDRLCDIGGNVAEFVGNTQLNFPDFADANPSARAIIDGTVNETCINPDGQKTGTIPDPHPLTAADVVGTTAVVPDDFYRVCGPGDTPIQGLMDPTSCTEAASLTRNVPRSEQKIDCKRDNFAMEAWEHGLVAFDNLTIGDRFENCDFNGDGKIAFGAGSAEGTCEDACTLDPMCTDSLSLEQYGQFAAAIDCTPIAGTSDAGTPPPAEDAGTPAPTMQCAAKIYISTRDTLGSSGYNVLRHAGDKLSRIVGHLRQIQPGAGVDSTWIVEPRSVDDFVSEGTP